jgi:hypothetical protein
MAMVICVDPILLKCGGNACKRCLNDTKQEMVDCKKCKIKHEVKDLVECISNSLASLIVKDSLKDIFQYLDKKIEDLEESFKGFI